MFGFGRSDRSPVNPVPLVRDAAGVPAVNLDKVREGGHLNLAKAAEAAGAALAVRGLAGIRAEAVVLLDHSGSMKPDYRSGAVRVLATRILGFTLQFDRDGRVPVIPFDGHAHPVVEVTVANHETVVEDHIWRPNDMGSTNLAEGLEVVREMAAVTKSPLYVVVLTDGEPDDWDRAAKAAKRTTKAVCALARYPVFLKFAALRPVAYLNTLDSLDDSHRLLDNCNAQPPKGSAVDLLACTDSVFQNAMAEEWDQWITRALAAGVLTA